VFTLLLALTYRFTCLFPPGTIVVLPLIVVVEISLQLHQALFPPGRKPDIMIFHSLHDLLVAMHDLICHGLSGLQTNSRR
jgi:hypothetical protein